MNPSDPIPENLARCLQAAIAAQARETSARESLARAERDLERETRAAAEAVTAAVRAWSADVPGPVVVMPISEDGFKAPPRAFLFSIVKKADGRELHMLALSPVCAPMPHGYPA